MLYCRNHANTLPCLHFPLLTSFTNYHAWYDALRFALPIYLLHCFLPFPLSYFLLLSFIIQLLLPCHITIPVLWYLPGLLFFHLPYLWLLPLVLNIVLSPAPRLDLPISLPFSFRLLSYACSLSLFFGFF